jgi:hypothetical protein
VAHRSGEALGAEAARRLATRDGLEVARPYDVEVVGVLGYVELHTPLTDAEIARMQDSSRLNSLTTTGHSSPTVYRWGMGGRTGDTAAPNTCATH